MADREKVIKALEVCTTGGSNCDGCPYFDPGKTFLYVCTMMDDALALLREQEPIEPDGDNCGECGYTLHRINYDGQDKELRHEWFRFCPSCGKAVKWDG